jgi:DNA-binding beta-propeller fold protein YncE
VVAVATEGMDTDDVGRVLFFSTDGFFINSVEVGVLPDMLIFTPDGSKLLTANEGEPSDDYLTDPEGSVSIIDLSAGINNVSNADVSTIDLSLFNDQQATLIEQGVRIFGPGATVAQDLEPEYIAISEDGSTAYVSCQENNAPHHCRHCNSNCYTNSPAGLQRLDRRRSVFRRL